MFVGWSSPSYFIDPVCEISLHFSWFFSSPERREKLFLKRKSIAFDLYSLSSLCLQKWSFFNAIYVYWEWKLCTEKSFENCDFVIHLCNACNALKFTWNINQPVIDTLVEINSYVRNWLFQILIIYKPNNYFSSTSTPLHSHAFNEEFLIRFIFTFSWDWIVEHEIANHFHTITQSLNNCFLNKMIKMMIASE